MDAVILSFEAGLAARRSAMADQRLVCTTSMEDATPNLMLAALVLWVGWWSGTGREVWRRGELAEAVADHFADASRRHGDPVDRAEDVLQAHWLIERALTTPDTPLRRLP